MSKILHFFNILFLYCGCFVFFLFFMPAFTVKADDFSFYDDPGVSSVYLGYNANGTPVDLVSEQTGVPHSVYYYSQSGADAYCFLLTFDIDNANLSPSSNLRSYNYTFEGVTHTVYYSLYGSVSSLWGFEFVSNCSGTREYTYNLQQAWQCQAVCNYFLFGEGSLDYEKPAQDIEDSDLDIVGLIGSFSTSLDSDPTTFKGFMSNFLKNIANMFTGGIFAGSSGGNNIFVSQNGNTVSSVPSCRLVWDSPEVSNISNYSDPSAVSYSIWIDGSSTVTLFQVGEWVDDASCSFNHLLLNDEPIVYNGTGSFYYSTGSDYETILNYVLNNSSFGGGSSFDEAKQSDIKLDTTISRIYIQAHRTDDNGDNLVGAISYVDFSTGYPVVYEGVSDSISDISPDDSGNGTTTIVTQPFTVSGDNIVYGDTITENNTINNYYGEGLVIGGNIPFLNAAYWLIQAVLELIKTLYASLLVPFIVLGWTGHL